jgi:hypothetical protein
MLRNSNCAKRTNEKWFRKIPVAETFNIRWFLADKGWFGSVEGSFEAQMAKKS